MPKKTKKTTELDLKLIKDIEETISNFKTKYGVKEQGELIKVLENYLKRAKEGKPVKSAADDTHEVRQFRIFQMRS